MTLEQKLAKRDKDRARKALDRETAYKILGNKCAKCDIDDERVFTIDHIVPILRRTKNEYVSGSYLRSLVARGLLTAKEVQILCANCHAIKTIEDRKTFVYALREE